MAITRLTSLSFTDDSVVAAAIADNAVVTAAINADAVTAAKIADNAVVTAAINTDAVTAAKIPANVISHSELANSSCSFAVKNVSQTFAANTHVKVDYSNEVWDTDSAFNTTNKRFVCPSGKAGKYWVGFHMMVDNASLQTDKDHYCRLRVNNVEYYWLQSKHSTCYIYGNNSMNCSGLVNLAAGDQVEVFYRHNNNNSIGWAAGYGMFWGFGLIDTLA